MKLTVYRQSGSPVHPEFQAQYQEEYRTFYDRCELKAEAIFAKNTGVLNRKLVPRMIILQRLLNYGERFLMRKYGGNDTVELPKTAKQWTALINKYSETPIMLAKEQKTGKLILLLMDDLQG